MDFLELKITVLLGDPHIVGQHLCTPINGWPTLLHADDDDADAEKPTLRIIYCCYLFRS